MRIIEILLLVAITLCSAQTPTRSQWVYYGSNGTLAEGFMNWSWAKVSLTNTEVVAPGDKFSASFVCNAWQGMYFSQASTWSVADYNLLSFWINGGPDGNEDVTVQLTSAQNSKTLSVTDYILPNHVIPANKWVQVKIPIDHFQAPSTEIKGLWFQANSAHGTSVAYFDDIAFVFETIPPVQGPNLAVDASVVVASIHPEIYGVTVWWTDANKDNFTKFVETVKLPLSRLGGDAMTRYNWQVDSSNSGFDWFFMGGGVPDPVVPGATVDNLISMNNQFKTRTVVTVPMIEYINKESALHCSFPKSIYGNQQQFNPYEHPNGDDCGNGKDTAGNNIIDKDPLRTDIPNTPAIQKAWVQHLNSKWGTADKSGIIYQLDNEVSNWAYMHRDVHPQKVTYPEIVNQTIIYATAIKEADPTAMVAAPSEIQFAWYPAWGGDKNMQYFLEQLKAYEQKYGKRILDSLDVHYPDADDNNWPTLKDVGLLRALTDEYYAGTEISFSEWSMSGLGPLNGAVAVADQLGQFARYSTLFASYWALEPMSTIDFTYRMFRNYDGKGSGFGDQYVNCTTANDAVLSIHSAVRKSDGALTLIVLNKISADQETKVSLKGFNPSSSAQVFEYGAANENSIVDKGTISVTSDGFSHTFSSFSITMVVLSRS